MVWNDALETLVGEFGLTPETIYLLRFECQVTRDQEAELSRWLKERNISYRRI